jgi:hypothetical protein
MVMGRAWNQTMPFDRSEMAEIRNPESETFDREKVC